MAPTIVRNARLFTSTDDCEDLVPGCLVFQDGVIEYVGPEEGSSTLAEAMDPGNGIAEVIDAGDRVVAPGFIDGHVHLLHFGLSLGKVDVQVCKTLAQIRDKIRVFARSHPADATPRILCKGWIQASTGREALASMLDDLDPDGRPIYVEALDLHSVWCSSAALAELGVNSPTVKDPPGGTIHRDAQGRPSGLLDEGCLLLLVWPFLAKTLTGDHKQAALHQAVSAYAQAGYTGVIDMAMEEDLWTALETYRNRANSPQNNNGGLPLHVAAHWLIPYSDSDEEIQSALDRAISMHRKFHPSTSPSFCVVGIKLIADGVVDSCTAALSRPYNTKPNDPVEPIWPADKMARVIRQADAAGLQIAVHAIGDRAITQTIDAFAALEQPISSRRHRIEHLELASERDAKRLGELGITASVQPVHSDPALFKAWPSLIGTHRCGRAFAYREFLENGAPVAFGTDAPTAAHLPLPNLYTATTRRSAIEPESAERTNPQFAVSLAAAVKAATAGGAYSRHAETWMGSLKKGMSADFILLDTDWDPAGLLAARVRQTWFQGREVFDAVQDLKL
ncbi:uncharacterized protein Z520_00887 [Fonsecaea multimorphosa CBS 102226]|uniref:Amidohydrolase 3 domain-containing protein n=1 Tax=Fonsecaea multimorphosa CBS 102226 TaxID=1442371 RepID=A0A0D2L532_9EURO|nr:uncharacterized protein Z520_00887 [Fonsecaea multimorphosa CBS 102226]KIY04194.1 hypothetical protein Z520_00887 [Fonsecaea multimorphosa CBS 102226]OAL32023.1 hypothetical protein AYO22_00893 [Fonsecaea multimorphosa]